VRTGTAKFSCVSRYLNDAGRMGLSWLKGENTARSTSRFLRVKEEGRVLPANQARVRGRILGYKLLGSRGFSDSFVVRMTSWPRPRGASLLQKDTQQTLRIIARVPSIPMSHLGRYFSSLCAQLTGPMLDTSPTVDADLRTIRQEVSLLPAPTQSGVGQFMYLESSFLVPG